MKDARKEHQQAALGAVSIYLNLARRILLDSDPEE